MFSARTHASSSAYSVIFQFQIIAMHTCWIPLEKSQFYSLEKSKRTRRFVWLDLVRLWLDLARHGEVESEEEEKKIMHTQLVGTGHNFKLFRFVGNGGNSDGRSRLPFQFAKIFIYNLYVNECLCDVRRYVYMAAMPFSPSVYLWAARCWLTQEHTLVA